ncbi:MAG TPA: glucosamine-6-phosphate isomerase [Methylomirabilota bacterium]|nr:glucosamine-6-phosphate isomerase [Methylomirabilota bacterium]
MASPHLRPDPLAVPKELLGRGSPISLTVMPDHEAVIAAFAEDLLAEYRRGRQAGRRPVVFIVPVGPVGQFERLAGRCNAERISLRDLALINMDEYLTPDGRDWIPTSDPLSFRRHMDARLYDLLAPELAPPSGQRVFPDPRDLDAVARAIAGWGGVDVCFGGIGITGHLAFNDPPEPEETTSLAEFRVLGTRVVRLSRETIVVNSMTAARGNLDRIPRLAVTVGMKEVLESRKVRIYMNREWQAAIVRKILHGPVTEAVPASLLQEHPDVRFTIAEYVAEQPEPGLR